MHAELIREPHRHQRRFRRRQGGLGANARLPDHARRPVWVRGRGTAISDAELDRAAVDDDHSVPGGEQAVDDGRPLCRKWTAAAF